MRIDAPTTTTAALPATGAGLAGSRDEFLRLFVAQLQNQNPLDPQSGADMVAQLAQITNVEQQVETNQRLEDLTAAQDAASGAGLANLVGRSVTADASSFTVDGDGPPPTVVVDSDARVAGGEAILRDADGREVARGAIEPGAPPTVRWGELAASSLPAGAYTIEVAATDASGAPVTGRPSFHAVVDAVEFSAGGQLLHLGHARIVPGAVITIARGGTP